MILNKETLQKLEEKHDGNPKDIIYEEVVDKFPREEIISGSVESVLTHPSEGKGNKYILEQTLEQRVTEWFNENITDHYKTAWKKNLNKFYNNIHGKTEKVYDETIKEIENSNKELKEYSLKEIQEIIESKI